MREKLAEYNEDMLFLDGYDDCLVGVVEREFKTIALYDRDKIIAKLMKSMSHEEAIEYFEYNILGSMGENNPAYVTFIEGSG